MSMESRIMQLNRYLVGWRLFTALCLIPGEKRGKCLETQTMPFRLPIGKLSGINQRAVQRGKSKPMATCANGSLL
ncbi:hypothetical protein [Paenibacillus sp. MY03]|uniref:hypothetical protein n=1 Tax=Paenibacillus sp. MY03 TaxID=302980 RepID=UPI00211B2F35|nr:hypothetical protein [Paenibacillus sp. MY03]